MTKLLTLILFELKALLQLRIMPFSWGIHFLIKIGLSPQLQQLRVMGWGLSSISQIVLGAISEMEEERLIAERGFYFD
jgi:hypothetical protein